MGILINLQFGRLDYTQYQVVSVPNPVAAPAGSAKPTPTAGLMPAC